jgi:hypothetical protein
MNQKEYKYRFVAGDIVGNIFPTMQEGQMLPTLAELCAKYETSEITVNKALKILAEKGFIKRIQSKGTVLVRQPDGAWDRGTPQKITLSVLGMPSWNFMDAVENCLSRFAAINRNVSYQITYAASEEYPAMLKANTYDLVLVNTWTLREILTTPSLEKKIIPLNKISGLCFDENAYHPDLLRWCGNNDRLMCLPVTFSPAFMICNMDFPGMPAAFFDRQSDWKSFIDVMRKISSHNKRPSFFMPISHNYWPILLNINNLSLFSENGKKCLLDTPEVIEMVKQLKQLLTEERLILQPIQTDLRSHDDAAGDMFTAGHLACIWASCMRLSQKFNFKSLCVPVPRASARATHLFLEGVMVGRHHETTKDFLNFLQTGGSLEFFNNCAGISCQKYFSRILLDSKSRHYIGTEAVLDSLEFAKPVIPVPRSKVVYFIEKELQMVWSGMLPVEEACRETARKANQMLANEEF